MDGWTILAIVLLLYGALCLALAVLKAPAALWNLDKIGAFKKLLGEVGTQVFIGVWGVAAVVLGVWLLVRQARAAMVGNLRVVLCAPRALAQTGRLPDDVGGLPKRGRPPKDPTGSAGAVAVPEPEEETP